MHTKFSRVYWLPGRMYLPVRNATYGRASGYPQATFDSFQEDTSYSDCTLNHYTTLGILQYEDQCPLLGVIQSEAAYKNAITQTVKGSALHKFEKETANNITKGPLLPYPRKTDSSDDINDLIIETYGANSRSVKDSRNQPY
uniref:Astacin n=1 Tax=Steinernema glaseri TaxID=37863 RepID=A0A1I8AT25_9BILA